MVNALTFKTYRKKGKYYIRDARSSR